MRIIKVVEATDPRMPLFTDRGKDFKVIYKLKGNRQYTMRLFAIDEIDAYTKAFEAIKKLKKET